MDPSVFRTLIDPLYGVVPLDSVVFDLIYQPELQRLREVRLSNINSLLLPGGANISRFEHSVGTAVLAARVADNLHISERDRCCLMCAALLHDVGITPFGHLMEEGYRYALKAFNHETRLPQVFSGERDFGNIHFQIFRGRAPGLRRFLEKHDVRDLGVTEANIFDLVQGKGALGPLIKGSIDLDNIDNVTRMAHHIGLPVRRGLPSDAVDGFVMCDGAVAFNVASICYIDEWLELRTRLYNLLMTNPVDLSAKAMFIEAIRLGLTSDADGTCALDESMWTFTDSDLVTALRTYAKTAPIIERLELGDFFDVLGMYWLYTNNETREILDPARVQSLRLLIADQLKLEIADVVLYSIPDRRYRSIRNFRVQDTDGRVEAGGVHLGREAAQTLLGVFVGKKFAAARRWRVKCDDVIQSVFASQVAGPCDPAEHIRQAFDAGEGTHSTERMLF
jgi:hypothetical protein